MSKFFLKVKFHDDSLGRAVVTRKRITSSELWSFCYGLLQGDIYRIEYVQIERLTNEN